MFNRTLSSFLPHIYTGILEMDALMQSEEQLMSIARTEMYKAFSNTFVLTADEPGIKMFENMLAIISSPETESLEFRRQRILNRLSTKPPFTFSFLKNKLDEIVGVGAWKAYIDYDNYTLYVESSAIDQSWYSEVEFTINRIKPCNIVFINVPYTVTGVRMDEHIEYTMLNWRYRMGSWRLGQYPFATTDGGGTIKMRDVKSIQPALLDDAASFVASDVAKVRINDSVEIVDFRVKQSSGNTVSIEYEVTPEHTNLITNIKLLRSDGAVLTQSAVYVPVTQTIVSKHIITVKEGT